MGKDLDSDRKFFCVTYFQVVRAVRCADSLFSRRDGYSGQPGRVQNAQNPARTPRYVFYEGILYTTY